MDDSLLLYVEYKILKELLLAKVYVFLYMGFHYWKSQEWKPDAISSSYWQSKEH
jgi:hypothetical protein